jgi:hypothetical protein
LQSGVVAFQRRPKRQAVAEASKDVLTPAVRLAKVRGMQLGMQWQIWHKRSVDHRAVLGSLQWDGHRHRFRRWWKPSSEQAHQVPVHVAWLLATSPQRGQRCQCSAARAIAHGCERQFLDKKCSQRAPAPHLQQFLREEAASNGRVYCQVSSCSSANQCSCLFLRGSLQAAAALRSKRA